VWDIYQLAKTQGQAPDIETIKKSFPRPRRAVVTAGMPYANGPLHLGHLAGAHVPADIYARWMRMLIGADNVLFVCGSDDHGSAGELSAVKAGKPIREMIDEINGQQKRTLERYTISVDNYTGTSRPDCLPVHQEVVQDFIRRLYKNGMLEKRISQQWYDPELGRFLQDRFVRGKCPNPKCDNDAAYSDECDRCGAHYAPGELIDPRSAISGVIPELRDTAHWWLDMWKVGDLLRVWIESKQSKWRTPVFNEVITTVSPAIRFESVHEPKFKELRATLPKHKTRYAPGKRVVAQFTSMADMNAGRALLDAQGIPSELVDDWAHRSVTRDVAWGIPVPPELDPEMAGKTIYVWPESLIAPISFSRLALAKKGQDPERYAEFWKDPEARIYQFLGQDNVYFYVLMQGAMWLGTQPDLTRLPAAGDYQLTDIFGCCLLMVGGEKMSKSRGNFFTGDQLLEERGYSPDQVRYFLALLGLPETSSNFDFQALDDRNKFLAGPLNAAFEKPISACHSKFGGRVPEGVLNEKVAAETRSLVQKYLRAMDRAEYTALLGAIENYARQINSMFTQFKPHDDRFPEEQRRDALYSCFYVLKNIMIMLYPFVPTTMDTLRRSLRLPEDVFRVDELGTPIPAGHEIGEKLPYFPAVAGTER
jgi:methionyl-tRNA synthetase